MAQKEKPDNVYGQLRTLMEDLERDHPDIMKGWEAAAAGEPGDREAPRDSATVLREGFELLDRLQADYGEEALAAFREELSAAEATPVAPDPRPDRVVPPLPELLSLEDEDGDPFAIPGDPVHEAPSDPVELSEAEVEKQIQDRLITFRRELMDRLLKNQLTDMESSFSRGDDHLKFIGQNLFLWLEEEYENWYYKTATQHPPEYDHAKLFDLFKKRVVDRYPDDGPKSKIKRRLKRWDAAELIRRMGQLPPVIDDASVGTPSKLLRYVSFGLQINRRDRMHRDNSITKFTGLKKKLERDLIQTLNQLVTNLERDLESWIEDDFSGVPSHIKTFFIQKLLLWLETNGMQAWFDTKLKERRAFLEKTNDSELLSFAKEKSPKELSNLTFKLRLWQQRKLSVYVTHRQYPQYRSVKKWLRKERRRKNRASRRPRLIQNRPRSLAGRGLDAALWPAKLTWHYRRRLLLAAGLGLTLSAAGVKVGIEIGRPGAEEVLNELPLKRRAIQAYVRDVDDRGRPFLRSINNLYGERVGSDKNALGRDKSIPLRLEDVQEGGAFYYGAIAMGLLEDNEWRPGWAGNIKFTNVPWPPMSDWIGINTRTPLTILSGQGGGSPLSDQACGAVREGLYEYGNTIPYQKKLSDLTCGMALARMTTGEEIDQLNASYSFLSKNAYGVNNFGWIYWGFLEGIHDPQMTIGHQLVLASMLRYTWLPNEEWWFKEEPAEYCSLDSRSNRVSFEDDDKWQELGGGRWKNQQSGEIVSPQDNGWINIQDRRWECIKGRAHTALRRMLESGKLDPLFEEEAYRAKAVNLKGRGKISSELWSSATGDGSVDARREILELIFVEEIRAARPKSIQRVERDRAQDRFRYPGFYLGPTPNYKRGVGQVLRELRRDIKKRYPELADDDDDDEEARERKEQALNAKMREIDSVILTLDPNVQRTVAIQAFNAAERIKAQVPDDPDFDPVVTVVAMDDEGRILGFYEGSPDSGAQTSWLESNHSLASLGKTVVTAAVANLPDARRARWTIDQERNFLRRLARSSERFPGAAYALGVRDPQVEALIPCYGSMNDDYSSGAYEDVSYGHFNARVVDWLPIMHHIYTGEPMPTPHVLESYTLRDGTVVESHRTPPDNAADCAEKMYAQGRTRAMMNVPIEGVPNRDGTLHLLSAEANRGDALAIVGKTGTYGHSGADENNWRAAVHALTALDNSTYTVFVAVDSAVDFDENNASPAIGTGGETAAPIARAVLRKVRERHDEGAF